MTHHPDPDIDQTIETQLSDPQFYGCSMAIDNLIEELLEKGTHRRYVYEELFKQALKLCKSSYYQSETDFEILKEDFSWLLVMRDRIDKALEEYEPFFQSHSDYPAH